jgi:gluconolactonase
MATSFQGQRLDRPNDVIVKSDGTIYFTDLMGSSPRTISGTGLIAVSIAGPAIVAPLRCSPMTFAFPNGLAFAPAESLLYIGDYLRGHIRACDVAPMALWRNRPTAFSLTSAGPVGLIA